MKEHYPLDPVTGIENAALPWTNGNPATGQNGSYPPFGLFIDPQAEIINAQRSSGLTDSAAGSDTAQLAQAISIGTNLGNISQPLNVNDLAVALPGSVTWPLLRLGMRFGGFISAPNTGPMTVTMTGFGTLPGKLNLVDALGNALVANAIPANIPFEFKYDGTQFRLSGSIGNGGAVAAVSPVNALIIPSPYTFTGSNQVGTLIPSANGGSNTKLTVFNPATNNVPSRLSWNASTSRLTVLVSGWYYVQMYLDTNLTPASYGVSLAMNRNGNSFSAVYTNTTGAANFLGPAFSAQRLLYMNANDYCEFFFGQNSGSAQYAPVSVLIEARGV